MVWIGGFSLCERPTQKMTQKSTDAALQDPVHKVLVHCAHGISLSAAFVIGYVMFAKQIGLDEAYNWVSKKRKVAPNLGFMLWLREWEGELGLGSKEEQRERVDGRTGVISL